jgi:hypothetical protein
MTTARPIDDVEVRAQLRAQVWHVFGAITGRIFVLTLVFVELPLSLVMVGCVVTGHIWLALRGFLALAICAAGGAVAGAALAALLSPAVLFFDRARRRALVAPWRTAHCISWNQGDTVVLVTIGMQHFVCTIGGIEDVPTGGWDADVADREGWWLVLRPKGSPSLLLAWRVVSPLDWTTQRVDAWDQDGGTDIHVRTDDADLVYRLRNERRGFHPGAMPDWISVADGYGRVVIRIPAWDELAVATVESRPRSGRAIVARV